MVLLESNKLFCDLKPADLERLRAVTRELAFAPNQIIFKEGDAGDGVYFVKDGLVQILATVAQGETKVLSRVPPGELFGEMAVLDNQPRSASAMAEQPTTVYFIGRAELDELLDRTPMLAAVLVREVSRRLRQFTRQYVREVLEAERLALVGRFASSIVHDLKNPLNIIGISADMAAMPTATAESRHNSTVRIRKQVERISTMVNELLDFTQGSRTEVILALLDYKTYVEQLIDEIRPEVAIKSVSIEYVNPPPSVSLRLDPQRLSRLFHNLIGNAADAMASGGTVKLSFTKKGDDIITQVQDTGKGIAPEIIDRLFQPFATYGKASGTGLGLSICKKIVQDHQGRIQARNAPGGGALFEFSLPIPSG
jgi:signal transduction histidine kinase